jgi:O-antigen/teichoic acid export membrane protein
MFASLFVFVSGLLKLLGGIIVIIGFPELTWLYLAIILAGLLAILFGHYLNAHYSRKVIASEKMSIEMTSTIEYIKRKTVYIPLLTTLGLVGLANVDIILIKKFMSGDLTGLYASLSLMGKIILYLTVPISDVAYSFFSNKDSRHQANKILLMTTLVYFFIGVVSVIGYTLFPEIIINVIFGSKFASLASVLYLSAIFGFLYSLLRLYSQYFVAQNDVWGILSIGGVLLQAVLIYLWHTSITQVFIINIGVFSLILFCFYLKLGFVYLNHNKSATRHLFGLKWL